VATQFKLEEFQDQIGYHFKSSNLLREALHQAGTAPPQGNKRLALVGDSVLSASLLDQWYSNGDTTGTFDNASGACVQFTNLK
jgi:dsRNA-specific ribonuclease